MSESTMPDTIRLRDAGRRRERAFVTRCEASFFHGRQPLVAQESNGDEERYPNRAASFTKTLPHDDLGEVDGAAYDAYLAALASGEAEDFEAVPAGGGRLANPQAAYEFCLVGPDSHNVPMPPAPSFASAWQAAEAGEVYWQAVTRDVPFAEYDGHELTGRAAEDLSRFSEFRGPKAGGAVTPATLFRGDTPGDLAGPYISQFLFLPVPYGDRVMEQTSRRPVAGDDHMTCYEDWLAVQRGQLPAPVNRLGEAPRYILDGRDLGEYVHRDFPFQSYLDAALICFGLGPAALDPHNPYRDWKRQGGFLTFGPAGTLDLVASGAAAALRPAWCHKWLVHRRLRPEAFGGRLHNHLEGRASYDIHREILDSPVLEIVKERHGTWLLPQAFPEGSPTHPSYPAGHAAIAGACVTLLKAFFNEDFVFPEPRVPSPDGGSLVPWTGEALTVGGELNKLAYNISLGRNTAGVHWRTDGADGIALGEAVAIGLLQDYQRTVNEPFDGCVFTRFDGTRVRVTASAVEVL